MKLDLTGIVDDGGFVALSPGRYSVTTEGPWYAKKSDAGNLVLRIPFTVVDDGEFHGVTNSYFHTIMLDGAKDKVQTNKVITYRVLANLGIVSDDDRGPNGELGLEFEFGTKSDGPYIPINAIAVNGNRRALDGYPAIAVVVKDDQRDSGVSVKSIEPDGVPDGPRAATSSAPQPEAKPAATGLPF